MPTMTIAAMVPPETGKKRWKITARDGTSFGAFAERVGNLKVGATYEVEINEVTVNGVALRNLKSAPLVADAPAPAAKPAAAPAAASNGNYYRPTDPTDAQRMFCAGALFALIKAGEVVCNEQQIDDTVRMLRRIWHSNFGTNAKSRFAAREAEIGTAGPPKRPSTAGATSKATT